MKTFYEKMKAAIVAAGKTLAKKPYYTAAGVIVVLGLAVGLPLGLAASCGGLPGDAVAKVGDQVISAETLESQLEAIASQYGITEDTNEELYAEMRSSILENLIATAIAIEKAEDLGVSVTDEEVDGEIDSIKAYYFGGDEEAFNQTLADENLTLEELRYQIRGDLSIDKVGQKVTEDMITVSDERVEAYYEANKDTFLTDSTVEARHILIAVGHDFERGTEDDTDYSDLQWAQALATAAQVRLQLLSGGSWSQLAARYSDDAETKNSGGDLGAVAAGDLEEAFGLAFENELFALAADEISELVQTVNGYHIIEVTKIVEPSVKTLEEAWDEAEVGALDEARNEAWRAWIENAKTELGVIYRDDLEPTTTTTEAVTTTTASDSTTTTEQ